MNSELIKVEPNKELKIRALKKRIKYLNAEIEMMAEMLERVGDDIIRGAAIALVGIATQKELYEAIRDLEEEKSK